MNLGLGLGCLFVVVVVVLGGCCYFIYLLIVYVCFVLEWVFLVILEVFVGSFSFCFNISLI